MNHVLFNIMIIKKLFEQMNNHLYCIDILVSQPAVLGIQFFIFLSSFLFICKGWCLIFSIGSHYSPITQYVCGTSDNIRIFTKHAIKCVITPKFHKENDQAWLCFGVFYEKLTKEAEVVVVDHEGATVDLKSSHIL